MASNFRLLRRTFPNVLRFALQSQQNHKQFSAFTHLQYNRVNPILFTQFNRFCSTDAKDQGTKENVVKENAVKEQSPSIPDKSEMKTFQFQAETRKLLDIVTHSLYTDKDVFVRELVSNASDALEKLNYLQVQNQSVIEPQKKLEIHLKTDEINKKLIIEDTGIGMSESELIENIGTIARSGSKSFIEALKNKGKDGDLSTIIGQFGVGFYSVFMVSDDVKVFSQSAIEGNKQLVWCSDGSGSYDIGTTNETNRGSRIEINLKDDCHEFCKPDHIKSIIKKYSNFINFPILLNNEKINTIQPIWTESPSQISEEDYNSFYKFIANAYDKPLYRLHFRIDAPLDLKALFFIPSFHNERFGFARMERGVGLYSRKVLIESKSEILPDWMRFIKGVVDSEDLPLSISREKPQDTLLIQRVKDVLVKRVIRFLNQQSKDDPEKFKMFFRDFGTFLKEGVSQDYTNKNDIAKLLLFESSKCASGEFISFDDYISRCPPEQKNIYFLSAKTRELVEASPYYESFKVKNFEVIFIYNPIDEFVMANISEYNGRKIVSAESSDIETDTDAPNDTDNTSSGLNDLEGEELCSWFMNIAPSKLRQVTTTKRLVNSPAVITGHETSAMRKMMQYVNQNTGENHAVGPQNLQINPSHPIILDLYKLKNKNIKLAEIVANQIVDNALVSADLMDDSKVMLPRLNSLLTTVLNVSLSDTSGETVGDNETKTTPTIDDQEVVIEPGESQQQQQQPIEAHFSDKVVEDDKKKTSQKKGKTKKKSSTTTPKK